LEKLSKDDDVKAVVLRIDSPGGSALASDLMWQKLMKIRAKKPLVVSVGDMAASGGYYLASTANVIYAEPTSILGSIGVVGGKIGMGTALGRVGIHVETFAASPKPGAANRAAYMSFVTPWDEPTKQRVYESMASIYELFLERVAEGRKTSPDKIAPHAEGRIFGGVESKRRGLVDEIGGLGDAIKRARELAKLPEDARVVAVRRKPKFLEGLEGGGDETEERAAAGAVRAAAGAPSLTEVLEEQAPDIAPFVSSLAPLASGERALACVPFVLRVR
jgi:protease-4